MLFAIVVVCTPGAEKSKNINLQWKDAYFDGNVIYISQQLSQHYELMNPEKLKRSRKPQKHRRSSQYATSIYLSASRRI